MNLQFTQHTAETVELRKYDNYYICVFLFATNNSYNTGVSITLFRRHFPPSAVQKAKPIAVRTNSPPDIVVGKTVTSNIDGNGKERHFVRRTNEDKRV